MLIVGLLLLFGFAWLGPSARAFTSQSDQAASKRKKRVPAHYTDLKDVKEIPKTLSPGKFTDPEVKKAYEVAEANPKLLLQMPCYCYCDAMGHKSLLSCYVDSHAAHCDICRDEAIEAERLQSEEKLTVEEVRERIIEKYSTRTGS